ncbi:hypothetical protein HAX54_043809, partial [Datura stramonium]|nr:hypothetical protein [Datura stramonium]
KKARRGERMSTSSSEQEAEAEVGSKERRIAPLPQHLERRISPVCQCIGRGT